MTTIEEFSDKGISELDIREANLRHDLEMGGDTRSYVRPAWNEGKLLRRGVLTDKKILQYEKAGHYSPDLKEARKTLADMRAKRRERRRSGNFDEVDGRMIYRP